jgi:hypothetical protein
MTVIALRHLTSHAPHRLSEEGRKKFGAISLLIAHGARIRRAAQPKVNVYAFYLDVAICEVRGVL